MCQALHSEAHQASIAMKISTKIFHNVLFLRKLLHLAPFIMFVKARWHKKLNRHLDSLRLVYEKTQTKPCSEKQCLDTVILLTYEKIRCLSFGVQKSAFIPCIISLKFFFLCEEVFSDRGISALICLLNSSMKCLTEHFYFRGISLAWMNIFSWPNMYMLTNKIL